MGTQGNIFSVSVCFSRIFIFIVLLRPAARLRRQQNRKNCNATPESLPDAKTCYQFLRKFFEKTLRESDDFLHNSFLTILYFHLDRIPHVRPRYSTSVHMQSWQVCPRVPVLREDEGLGDGEEHGVPRASLRAKERSS